MLMSWEQTVWNYDEMLDFFPYMLCSAQQLKIWRSEDFSIGIADGTRPKNHDESNVQYSWICKYLGDLRSPVNRNSYSYAILLKGIQALKGYIK